MEAEARLRKPRVDQRNDGPFEEIIIPDGNTGAVTDTIATMDANDTRIRVDKVYCRTWFWIAVILGTLLVGGLVILAVVLFTPPVTLIHDSSSNAAGFVSAQSKSMANQNAPVTRGLGCMGLGDASLELRSMSTAFSPQCAGINQWTVSTVASDQSSPVFIDSSDPDNVFVGTFKLQAIKSTSGESVLSVAIPFSMKNIGKCDAKISSVVAILEQSTKRTNDPISYGPSGKKFKVWAITGVENQATSGLCGTPNMVHICNMDGNTRVPTVLHYTSSTGLGALDLSRMTVPAFDTLQVNLTVQFSVSAASLQAIAQNPANFRITLFVTHDTCCDMSNALCLIDVDCQGGPEPIRSVPLRSSTFTFPVASCQLPGAGSSCGSLQIDSTIVTTTDTDSSSACTSHVEHSLPTGMATTSSRTQIIGVTGICDAASSCDCDREVNVKVVNQLTTGECVHPVTGANLVTLQPDIARLEYTCSAPPEQPCILTTWSEWSNCGIDETGLGEFCEPQTRTRSVISPGCHGSDQSCGILRESRPCTTACSFVNTTLEECETGTCRPDCFQTILCRREADQSSYCLEGSRRACPNNTQITERPCEACVFTEWSEWTPTENCREERERSLLYSCHTGDECPLSEIDVNDVPCSSVVSLPSSSALETPSPVSTMSLSPSRGCETASDCSFGPCDSGAECVDGTCFVTRVTPMPTDCSTYVCNEQDGWIAVPRTVPMDCCSAGCTEGEGFVCTPEPEKNVCFDYECDLATGVWNAIPVTPPSPSDCCRLDATSCDPVTGFVYPPKCRDTEVCSQCECHLR